MSAAPPSVASQAARRAQQAMFGSLNSRLLAAFVLVILVTLLSAGVGVVWLVQEYQRRLAVDRFSEVAVAASLLGRQLEMQGARPAEIGDTLAGQLATPPTQAMRVLLIDSQDRVLVERPAPTGDADEGFSGARLVLPDPADRSATAGRPLFFRWRAQVWTTMAGTPPRPYTFVAAPRYPPPAAPGTGRCGGPP